MGRPVKKKATANDSHRDNLVAGAVAICDATGVEDNHRTSSTAPEETGQSFCSRGIHLRQVCLRPYATPVRSCQIRGLQASFLQRAKNHLSKVWVSLDLSQQFPGIGKNRLKLQNLFEMPGSFRKAAMLGKQSRQVVTH